MLTLWKSNIINLTFWYDKSFGFIHQPIDVLCARIFRQCKVGWFVCFILIFTFICANLRMYFNKSSFSIVTFSLVVSNFFFRSQQTHPNTHKSTCDDIWTNCYSLVCLFCLCRNFEIALQNKLRKFSEVKRKGNDGWCSSRKKKRIK